MSRTAILISFPFVLIAAVYFLGPEPAPAKWNLTLPTVPQNPTDLEHYVANQEAKHKLKPDNEARIIWADSTKQQTEYSVVYLHGFSASQEEGDPVHENFAREFGCNLYLARLADHGIDTTEQLLNFTVDRWWESSKEAFAIGKAIGKKVIIMSTSTGGTSALVLAAEYPEDVFALINMSPNIAINNKNAWLSNNPWGLQIARLVVGGNYLESKMSPERANYWNAKYRIEAIPQLEEMLEEKMNSKTFSMVKCPSLTLYYYKNELEQDPTVKVSAILKMHEELSTPDSMKVAIPIPNAGAHVIGSHLVSGDLQTVQDEVKKFAIEKLKMKLISN